MKTTAESDNHKQEFLFDLAKACLQQLEVSFTTTFLKEVIDKAYFLTFETAYSDEHDRNKITVADKEDPGNLAIVLLEALKRYHIKNEIADMHTAQKGTTSLLILSCQDKSYDYRHLLVVQQVGSEGNPHSSKTIENSVIFKMSEFTGEPGYALNQKKEKLNKIFTFLISSLLVIAFGMAVYKGFEKYPLLLWMPCLFLLLAGFAVCYQLYQLEKTNTYASTFLKKMCSAKKDFDCKEVISSSASKLFGVISHTDIGMLYFSSLIAVVVMALISDTYEQYVSFLFWLAVFPLPYTLFSVYHQLYVIKKICVMCLMIQLILWTQFTYFMLLSPQINIRNIRLETVIQAGLILSTLSLLYFIFAENKRIKVLRKLAVLENFKFKNSNLFFEEAMEGQIKFIQEDFPVTFSLGDPAATEKMGVVLSLFCAPCRDELKELLRLADWFEDKIDIQIIIKPDAPAASFIKELMMYIDKGEIKKTTHLLSQWYDFFQKEKEQGNYNPVAIISKWNKYYPLTAWSVQIETQYAFHHHFYENHPMPFTPLVQYNGRLLPGTYHDAELLSNKIERCIAQEQNYDYA